MEELRPAQPDAGDAALKYLVAEKGGESQAIGLEELSEGLYEVQIDGVTLHVDAAKSGRTIYSIIQDGQQYEAMAEEKGAHGFDVLVRGQLFHLEAQDERSQLLAASAQTVAEGKQVIEAEMPGKVVKLEAAVGDTVVEGQGVLVLEAMKMENEIPSPIDGIVTEIGVSEGEAVEGGQLLFVVEPPEQAD